MELTAQKNDLCLEDPLEKLRGLFRSYWRCITKEELEKANDIWENSVPIELESIYQSYPEISRESLQIILFEEKRRLQDHGFLVDTIVEKLAACSNQTLMNSNEISKVDSAAPYAGSSDNGRTNHSNRKIDASEELSTDRLNLTAMIDSMLEGEKKH